MGDLGKSLKIIVPIAFFVITGGVGGFEYAAWMGQLTALEAIGYGLALSNLLFGKKKSRAEFAATYGLGQPDNTARPLEPVGVLYGELRLYGSTIYNNEKSDQEADRIVVLCEGEVESVSDVRLNNYLISEFTGCSADAYTGTMAQANDSRFADGKGTLKGLAYVAATLKSSEHLKSSAVVSALVKGRKVGVYNGASWSTEYSDNPAWCIRDLLINYANISESDIDGEGSWYTFAQHCDETVTDEYDSTENVALGATFTGGSNHAAAHDGKLLPLSDTGWWYVDIPLLYGDEDLEYLGQADLGSATLVNRVRLHLWDGDDREYYNWKMTASANGSDWDTLFDGTGSGKNYKGVQDIELSPTSYRYFRVYGSKNSITETAYRFHVKELEIWKAEPAPRYRIAALINESRTVAEVLFDMLATCDAFLFQSKGLWKIGWNEAGAATAAAFDESNILPDTFYIQDRSLRDDPNQFILKYVDRFNGWRLTDVYDNDPVKQAADGIKKKEYTMEMVTRAGQARRMVRRMRNVVRKTRKSCMLRTGLKECQVEPGDIFTVSYDQFGFVNKKWRCTRVVEMEDGTREIYGSEWYDSVYGDEAGAATDGHTQRALADPAGTPPKQVTGLAISEGNAQPGDGAWVPVINVTWTNPGDRWFERVDIEISTDSGTTYRVVGSTNGEEYTISGDLEVGQEYYVRVRSVSEYGLKASADGAMTDSITIAGKDSPPSDISTFDYRVGVKGIELYWNSAVDANNDLSHYEIRYGASWASGTTLVTDLKATSYMFRPTARTYAMMIKAFDRSGNESDNEKALAVSVPAPAGPTAAVTQLPPARAQVNIPTINNENIIRYDVHVSTSPGFTPVASTLKTNAAGGISATGYTQAFFDGAVGTTYYVKVCAIDHLSEIIGDQYTYPGGQQSVLIRNIEGSSDIVANTILTNHLSTAGIDVGGGGDKPIYIRVKNSGGSTVGYVGQYTQSGTNYWGGRFLNLYVGQDGDPYLQVTSGSCRISRDVVIGDVGTADGLLSTAENGVNVIPNSGFEHVRAVASAFSYSIPGWTADREDGTGDVAVVSRAVLGEDYFHGGKYGVKLTCSNTSYGRIYNTTRWAIQAGVYQVSLYARLASSSPSTSLDVAIIYYDKNLSAITTDTPLDNQALTTTMTRYSASFTAPATACFARIYVAANRTGSGSQDVYVDSIQVEKGYSVTAYAETRESASDGPVGLTITPGKGYEVFNGGTRVVRIGDIGGLSDGSGTIAASTMGLWNKGSAYFLDSSGDLMMGLDGIEGGALFAGSVAESVLDSALMTKIGDGSDPNSPNEYYFAIETANVINFTDKWPVKVAHGQSNVPMVEGLFRAYDTSGTAYSRWYPLNFSLPLVVSNATREWVSFIEADSTNIYFHIVLRFYYGTTWYWQEFSATYKTYLYLARASDGVLDNCWDQIYVKYWIKREGA